MASYMKDLESGLLAVTREVSFVQGWNHFKNEEQMQGEMEDDEGHTLIIVPHQESRFRPTSGSRWVCEISLCPLNRHGRRILPAKLIKKVSTLTPVPAKAPIAPKPVKVTVEPKLVLVPPPDDDFPTVQEQILEAVREADQEAEELVEEFKASKPIPKAKPLMGGGAVIVNPRGKKARKAAKNGQRQKVG